MRTNIVIDDNLISEAMMLTGIKTKREVVHEALRLLVNQSKQSNALATLQSLRGKITFWDDIDGDDIVDMDSSAETSAFDHTYETAAVNYGRILNENQAEYASNRSEEDPKNEITAGTLREKQ